MIIKAETLKEMEQFKDIGIEELTMKLKAIEILIRAYTNNNFQNRAMRIEAETSGGNILGTSHFFKVGDTIQISQTSVNDGLYVITAVIDKMTQVDGDLFDNPWC